MKVKIEFEVDPNDETLFLKSLAFFTWHNPAGLFINKLIIDDNDLEIHKFWNEYCQAKYVTLKKVEDFKNLIEST